MSVAKRLVISIVLLGGVAAASAFLALSTGPSRAPVALRGLSGAERTAISLPGVQSTIATGRVRNREFLERELTVDDVRYFHGAPQGLLNLAYQTIEEMSSHALATLIVRRVEHQQFALGDPDYDWVGISSTIMVTDVLKGTVASRFELFTGIYVPGRQRGDYIGVSSFHPIPDREHEGIFFLHTSLDGHWVPAHFGVYFIDEDGRVRLPEGAADLLKVDGRPLSPVLNAIRLGVESSSAD